MSSQVTNVIVMYFVSALELETKFWFLLFHDIKLPPTRIQYPEVKHLLFRDPSQSVSEYPTISVLPLSSS